MFSLKKIDICCGVERNLYSRKNNLKDFTQDLKSKSKTRTHLIPANKMIEKVYININTMVKQVLIIKQTIHKQ